MIKYDIDTSCPCTTTTTALPRCHIHQLVIKLKHVTTLLQNKYKQFQSSIAAPQPPCSDIGNNHHSAAPRSHSDLVNLLFDSYKITSKVALNIAIVQQHNNSRLQDLPTSQLGGVLCYMKRLLVTRDFGTEITLHNSTLAAMDVSQIVPYTCQTLKDSVHLLKQVKTNILETFYSRRR
ncbi:uncharacterized protein LOC125659248 [Ostrea edulis]|uniref:uncharacterized protein LOC125659248 n=1 Tax=Ostrea edulis TaxID=37623 RepID=UPI0020964C1F|nr:uncharacterized protein LOC125659248 [Ostrea edulis]